jgi:hypothetical protein
MQHTAGTALVNGISAAHHDSLKGQGASLQSNIRALTQLLLLEPAAVLDVADD